VRARPSGWRVAALGAALAAGGAWQAVALLVLLAAVLWADDAAGALFKAVGAVRERAWQRRELGQRRLELLEQRLLDLQAALALQSHALPAPPACAHEQAVPVPDRNGNVVAWLCPRPECDAQFPADFSVCEEAR
jgi:hypothetical protein